MSSASSGGTDSDLPLLGPAVPDRAGRAPRRAPQRQGVLAPISAGFLRERRQRAGKFESEELPAAGGLADDQWIEEGFSRPDRVHAVPSGAPFSPAEPVNRPAAAEEEDLFWLRSDSDSEAPSAGLEASAAGAEAADGSDRQELPPHPGPDAYGPEREEPSGDFGFPDPPEPLAEPTGSTYAGADEVGGIADDSWLSLIDPESPTRAEPETAADRGESLDLVSGPDLYSTRSPKEESAPHAAAPAPEWEAGPDAGARVASAARAAGSSAAPLLQDVAERLEQIARSLRQRAPAEIFSDQHPADPLEILITGYAIGYSEASRQARDRKRESGGDPPRRVDPGN